MDGDGLVKLGKWVDWGKPDHPTQLLVTDFTATILKATVAIFIGLSAPLFYKIVVKHWLSGLLLAVAKSRASTRKRNGNAMENSDESSPLIHDNGEPAFGVMEKASLKRSLLYKIPRYLINPANEGRTLLGLVGVVVIGIYAAWQTASLFASNIATDRVALSGSDTCRFYLFNRKGAGDEISTRYDLINRQKEARAGAYSQACYEATGRAAAANCDFFYRPYIPHKQNNSVNCAFPNGERGSVCAQSHDGSRSVKFDTGLVNSNDIGINDPNPFKFRRSTNCSAISVDDRFVSNETSDGVPKFNYYFGELYDPQTDEYTEYTFNTTGDPFEWKAPTYVVDPFFYPYAAWEPSSELQIPPYSSMTLIFVTQLHIWFTDRSEDTVFPAPDPKLFPGDKYPYFRKSDPKSRAFACYDQTQLCAPDGTTCWYYDEKPKVRELPPTYWLMKLALYHSTIYDSMVYRLGNSFIAQERVAQFRSVGLGDNHWMLEAERMFNTSLARAQFDAWSVAIAEDKDKEYYEDWTPDEAGNLCSLFKFQSPTHINYTLFWFVFILLVPVVLTLLSLECKSIRSTIDWTADFVAPVNDWIGRVINAIGRLSNRPWAQRVCEFFILHHDEDEDDEDVQDQRPELSITASNSQSDTSTPNGGASQSGQIEGPVQRSDNQIEPMANVTADAASNREAVLYDGGQFDSRQLAGAGANLSENMSGAGANATQNLNGAAPDIRQDTGKEKEEPELTWELLVIDIIIITIFWIIPRFALRGLYHASKDVVEGLPGLRKFLHGRVLWPLGYTLIMSIKILYHVVWVWPKQLGQRLFSPFRRR